MFKILKTYNFLPDKRDILARAHDSRNKYLTNHLNQLFPYRNIVE